MPQQKVLKPFLARMRARLFTLIATGAITLMSSQTIQANAQPGAFPSEAEGLSFLDGRWRVHHRKLKEPLSGREEWLEFEGSAAFFTLLDGLVSVEELRDAAGAPFGSAMRTFDRERRTWSDSWVGARDGVLQPQQHGSFVGDTGTFIAPDTYNGQAILVRGVWRRISRDVVTWEQACSLDDGKTWELNWAMRFERIAGSGSSGQ